MFTFKKEKEIVRQIDRYIEYKTKRSRYAAEQDRVWVERFCKVTGCDDIFKATEKLDDFKRYLMGKYGYTSYYVNALHSLGGFLKFYRCIGWTDNL